MQAIILVGGGVRAVGLCLAIQIGRAAVTQGRGFASLAPRTSRMLSAWRPCRTGFELWPPLSLTYIMIIRLGLGVELTTKQRNRMPIPHCHAPGCPTRPPAAARVPLSPFPRPCRRATARRAPSGATCWSRRACRYRSSTWANTCGGTRQQRQQLALELELEL